MTYDKLNDIDPHILDGLLIELRNLNSRKVLKYAPNAPVFLRNKMDNSFDEIAVKTLKKQGYKKPIMKIILSEAIDAGIIGWWLDNGTYLPIINDK